MTAVSEPARRRSSARPERRAQILATAAELFAHRGFHGVSIDELGAAVGVSGPALYRYFPSKDAMLTETALITVQERNLAHLPAADRHRVRQLQRRYVETWVDVLLRVLPDADEA